MLTGASDAAAPASVAASWDARVGACDATALLRFWENWLIDSVPDAWYAAHLASGSDSSHATEAQHQLRFFFDLERRIVPVGGRCRRDGCLWEPGRP